MVQEGRLKKSRAPKRQSKKNHRLQMTHQRSLAHGLELILFCLLFSGCGYSYHATLPENADSIAVIPFENRTFEPGLEIDFNKILTRRILFEGLGSLKTTSSADTILRGELLEYDREPLRYTDSEEIQEYRLKLFATAVLEKQGTKEILWQEKITGETTFFAKGSFSRSEILAREDLLDDLARRLSARLSEHWK